jgi:hypothetical protein
MSHRQKQTALLKALVNYGNTEERRKLFARVSKAERDEHASWCALWLVIVLSLFSLCGLCYASVLLPDFFRSASHLSVKVLCVLGLASAACSIAFMGCWLWYRGVLNRLHEESRRFILEMLESQSSDPSGRSARNSTADNPDELSVVNSFSRPSATLSLATPAPYRSYWELLNFRRTR